MNDVRTDNNSDKKRAKVANQPTAKYDWSRVDAIIEKHTGKSTPTREQITKLLNDSLDALKQQLAAHTQHTGDEKR